MVGIDGNLELEGVVILRLRRRIRFEDYVILHLRLGEGNACEYAVYEQLPSNDFLKFVFRKIDGYCGFLVGRTGLGELALVGFESHIV